MVFNIQILFNQNIPSILFNQFGLLTPKPKLPIRSLPKYTLPSFSQHWVYSSDRNGFLLFSLIKYMFRNTFEETTRLYNPLRETLEKSKVQDPSVQLARSRVYDRSAGMTSRVSRRMRSLSPQEVDELTKSTILTDDRELVPTDHLWKVRGKQFTAVSMEVKEGRPIPEGEMAKRLYNSKPGIVTTETVYELRSRPNNRSLNNSFRPQANFRLQSPPPNPPASMRPNFTVNSPQTISNVRLGPPVAKVASPVRIRNEVNMNPRSEYQLNSPPSRMSNNTQSNVTLDRVSTNYMPTKNSSYKYNLFSIFDEAVNSGCGSCGKNEVIATKPNSYWE